MHDVSKNVNDEKRNQYQALLQSLRSIKSSAQIPNRFPWHSKIAFQELLDEACRTRNTIRLLSGSVTDEFYRDVIIGMMEVAARNGCAVKVLVVNKDGKIHGQNVVSLSKDYPHFQVQTLADGNLPLPHFLLVGESAYRRELGHEHPEDCKYTETYPDCPAVINFNDRSEGTLLAKLFDVFWDRSSPVV